jgi:hypothetical protein
MMVHLLVGLGCATHFICTFWGYNMENSDGIFCSVKPLRLLFYIGLFLVCYRYWHWDYILTIGLLGTQPISIVICLIVYPLSNMMYVTFLLFYITLYVATLINSFNTVGLKLIVPLVCNFTPVCICASAHVPAFFRLFGKSLCTT